MTPEVYRAQGRDVDTFVNKDLATSDDSCSATKRTANLTWVAVCPRNEVVEGKNKDGKEKQKRVK